LDNLDSKLNNQVAILICGHGSRNKLAITEFQELTKLIQKRYPNILVEYGFLEFAKPSVHWSWGNRQKTGRKAFSQKLSKRIIDTKTSQQTYDLTSQLVGLD